MAKRIPEKQSEHDKVVNESAETWRRNEENVAHVNPNREQNFSVNKTSFPDVVITDRSNKLVAVEEIETESSINEEEKEQWKEYASFGVKFNLVVPEKEMPRAFGLSRDVSNITIQGYRMGNGVVEFTA